MSDSNNFGPYWTVNSQEVGGGIVILMFLVLLPILPLVLWGFLVGQYIADVKIVKYGMAILFGIVGYMILRYLWRRNPWYVVSAVVSEWVVCCPDVIFGWLKNIFHWAFSA